MLLVTGELLWHEWSRGHELREATVAAAAPGPGTAVHALCRAVAAFFSAARLHNDLLNERLCPFGFRAVFALVRLHRLGLTPTLAVCDAAFESLVQVTPSPGSDDEGDVDGDGDGDE